MKEDGKRVRRFRTGMNVVDLRMYFRNMAEQGFILDEMDHLQFIFLEMGDFLCYNAIGKVAPLCGFLKIHTAGAYMCV